jgi:peptide/nickel transport system ATP-binding protein/oligopeptide transport system ATP-binding protein
MKEILLDVKELRKYFPIVAGVLRHQVGLIKAVDGINFSIAKGEILGMVGESGSGKSTAARAAIRLIEPTAGQITLLGKSLMDLTSDQLKAIRKNVQMIFQDPYSSLNPRRTIGDSIGEALLYHQFVLTHEEKEEQVAEVLKKVGLSPDSSKRYPHEFSGGQQQRICIGRAIAIRPQLIICDEAVSALDVSIQAQIINLLLELKEMFHLSYLFISHDLSVIRHMADQVVVLHLGKIVETALTEELFNQPKHPYTQALLSAIPKKYPIQRNC